MSADAGGESREAAANNIRETTKWIIAAFAAPLAIMVGTSPLSNLGALQGVRLVVAVVSGVAGIGAILWAIKLATDVLVMKTYFLGQIKKEQSDYVNEHADDLLPAGFDNFATFLDKRKEKLVELTSTKDEERKDVLRAQLAIAQTIITRIITVCHYERMRTSFEEKRLKLLMAAVFVALAFGAFAWANSAPSKPDAKPPVSVYCASPAH